MVGCAAAGSDKELERVRQMFDDVQHQHQIIVLNAQIEKVTERESNVGMRILWPKRCGVRRDIESMQLGARKGGTQFSDDSTGAAAYIDNCIGHQMVQLQHTKHLLSFP